MICFQAAGIESISIISHEPDETFAIGKKLGASLEVPSIICFYGNLAAGKTTFIKGLIAGSVGISADLVSSPTFVLFNSYEGCKPVYHFDLYRLQNHHEFFELGFDEYWYMPGICCIEWSERIDSVIPKNAIKIHMEMMTVALRKITIGAPQSLKISTLIR